MNTRTLESVFGSQQSHEILNVVRILLALFGPPLIIFVSPSVELLTHNLQYFDGLSSAFPLLIAAAIYLAIGAVLYVARQSSKILHVAFHAYVLSSPLWIIHTAIIGLVGKALACLGLASVGALAAIYIARSERVADYVITATSLFALSMLATAAFKVLQINPTPHAALEPHRLGFEKENVVGGRAPVKLPDIYHIVLDEFQTDMFASVLDSVQKSRLRGSVWFPNSSTPFGRTEMALASLFSGTPYNYRQTPSEYIRNAFNSDQSLLKQLKSKGYETIAFLHEVYPGKTKSPFDRTYFHRDLKWAIPMADQRTLMTSMWLYAYMPEFLTRRLMSQEEFLQLESQTLLPNDAPYISLLDFRRFLDWESDSTRTGGRYIFLHLILPHFPHVLAADCSYRRNHNTRTEDQVACAVRVIEDLFDLLDKRDRFKGSLIIVHGDHGGWGYVPGKLQIAEDDHYGISWSWGRSRPLVLIKPANVGRDREFMIDERSADLFDIFPTVFASIDLRPEVPLVGSSLLAAPGRERDHYYHFYDKDPDHIVDGTVKRYKILNHEIVFDRELPVPR